MRLFLCEKPSQGKDIAKVLGATQRGDGCLVGPGVTVTWGIGHLLETAQPESYDEAYKRWSLQDLPIVPAQWKMEVKSATATQFKIVKKLLAQASALVIATDADREGEMIARELVDYCGYRGPIERLWLSALNEASIRKALAELKPGAQTFPLYHSALARSRADWLIGMNLSRLFTLLGRQAGYSGVLSVGRVQTPTLRLVVDRDRQIAHFVPVPFWSLEVQLFANGQAFTAHWVPDDALTDDEGRCLDQGAAAAVKARLAPGLTAIAITVETNRVKEAAPLPFDLGTLQEVCSKRLGLGAKETLDVAQALYETHKATTYPRTDCGYLPESMLQEVPAVLAAVAATDLAIAPVLQTLDRSLRSRAWNDSKITAHHGIIPTLEAANLAAMSEKERAVYGIIRAHYLAQFLPHHEFDRTVADFNCEGVALQAVGKRIVVPGWRALFGQTTEEDDSASRGRSQLLPPLQNASRCQVQGVELKAQQTQPPKPFTEGDLVKAMKNVAKLVEDPRLKATLKETTGIGTEATRAGIIQGLIDRQYLVKKNKAVRATEAAFTLIDAVPKAVADPGTTAVWEQALDLIESGQLSLEAFVAKQSTWITSLVNRCSTMTLSIKLPPSPACPLCGAPMSRRKGTKGEFWSCSKYPDCKGIQAIDGAGKSKRRPGKAKETSPA
ncbi:DNA topoisomerase III [Azotobacter bryophylli]|uniref:DNA topoisomerase n=1 Tax=Azotobacter bryophylli TaxID=1986537 RepID=A0ABV7AWB0_9GAMM